MSNLFWLSDAQMDRIRPHFPKSHGRPRVDDRRVLSGIFFILRNGLRWCDAPREYGSHKTLYNRFVRWSAKGIFEKIFKALAIPTGSEADTLMIDATHLKAHRTASSLKKGAPATPDRANEGRDEQQTARRLRRRGPPDPPASDGGSAQRF